MKRKVIISFLAGVAVAIGLASWAGLETGTYISQLVPTNPTGSDDRAQGDDHLRLIKTTILNTFPNITGAVTATHTELNALDGVTSSAAELNILDGVTATASEINILDGVTSSAAELNILDGATLSTTELNYVDGVTSALQAQLDAKLASSSYTAADVLSKLLTVDGSGSGVDADTLDGSSSASFAASATSISVSGTGLSGGGNLSTNRTITIDQTTMTTRNITGKSGVTKTLSTSGPSGGSDGDIWYVYE